MFLPSEPGLASSDLSLSNSLNSHPQASAVRFQWLNWFHRLEGTEDVFWRPAQPCRILGMSNPTFLALRLPPKFLLLLATTLAGFVPSVAIADKAEKEGNAEIAKATEKSLAISSADRAFFENRIRPVLVSQCYECHSADSKELGGKLRLDSRSHLQAGGESGPAIVAGEPAKSLLIQALRYDGVEMPPEAPLSPKVIADFAEWVRRGTPDPRVAVTAGEQPVEAEPESLWSLQPIATHSRPKVSDANWPRESLDYFVLRKLEAAGLPPNADASPRTLIRRLYYDLIGLSPTYEEVKAFERAAHRDRQEATEALVDELLSRPQFGERWGRHWLDVVRYGESNGNDGLGRNPTFPHAWRYRDYVISAWNEDLPFDQFLTEQIAGDLLPSDSREQRDRRLVATGMLAMAAKPAKAMNTNFAMDVVADQLDVIGRGVIGLSVACARCHDHKFDPIPTRDYYSLAGIFTSSETMWGVAAHEGLTAPPTDLHQLQAARVVPPPAGFKETVLVLESNTGKPKPIPKSKWKVGAPLAMGVRDAKKIGHCKINIKGEANKLGPVAPRGFLSAIGNVRRRVSKDAVLPPLEDSGDFERWKERKTYGAIDIHIPPGQSGRLQLAQWLTSPDHPLTSRVIANRVWLHLFGEGIVRTPDDFGIYGERPTHPELLDHLANQLLDNGWSLKQLIRTIVLSRTYQLNSDAVAKDPQDLLWARHPCRRLDAEALRDSMLQVSGELDLQPAVGSIIRHRDILVNLAGNLHQPSRHRSVYLCYLRSSPPPELAAFDLPDFTGVLGKRNVSTVPSQALHLFNSPFVLEQARTLARQALSQRLPDDSQPRSPSQKQPRLATVEAIGEVSLQDESSNASFDSVNKGQRRFQIEWLYRRVLQREPTAEEKAMAERLLRAAGQEVESHKVPTAAQAHLPPLEWTPEAARRRQQGEALTLVAHGLLLTNEFRFVD